MKILLWAVIIFYLSFLIHLVVWKVRVPRRQTKVLLQIFFSTLIIGLITLSVSPYFIPDFATYTPESLLEYLHISIFSISLILAYMITYSAIEVDSPSLVMVNNIAKAGSDGLDKKEFERILNNSLLVKPRIHDLITDKMAYMDGDKYRLTSKGILVVRIFILYRKLLNASKGG